MRRDLNLRRLGMAAAIVTLVLGACRLATPGTESSAPGLATGSTGPLAIPRCEAIEPISAPAGRYRDSPVYVANEQPVEEVRAWAASQPGFEALWLDRDHLGWITLAFSAEADARQADLERLFPDVGAVVVETDWTMSQLEALQRRIGEELAPMFDAGSWISVQQGVVGIAVGVLHPDRVAAIEERFGDERICLEGIDPADAPAAGPQQPSGDGWRLLADEPGAGAAYRTGIATDLDSYEQLWRAIGLSGELPPVDFESEVVIWFGAVYGSSCPNLRLDEVVVDARRAVVYADIVLVDAPMACTDDANPRAYVVALERSDLPAGPFAIQLGSEDPPRGAPEERTLVDVDLSQPGSVAAPGEVHGDPALPGEPSPLESGAVIEPGFPAAYRLWVHCGIEWLGNVNGVEWRTDAAGPPEEWQREVDESGLAMEVTLLLRTEPEPLIEATAGGRTVTYRPTAETPPGCD